MMQLKNAEWERKGDAWGYEHIANGEYWNVLGVKKGTAGNLLTVAVVTIYRNNNGEEKLYYDGGSFSVGNNAYEDMYKFVFGDD